jgi:lambda repressor-like predicted transcriptional regulator
MNINKNIIRAIARSGLDFEDVAIFSGILSTALVKDIQGKAALDNKARKRVADVLDVPVEEIWPDRGKVHCRGVSH